MDIDKIKYITKELIKFRTVRPDKNQEQGGNNKANFLDEINNCMDFILDSLDNSIIIDKAENFVQDNSCPISIAKFYDNKSPDLLVIGHIDVVDADENQFHPFEESGKIYGRGSKDMKSGVAVMIEVMNHYAHLKTKPNIAIAIVSDEESGSYNGANIIADKMEYLPKFVISPDPGERHCVINKEKGFIWFEVITYGRSAHPSRPWLADCAFDKTFKIWKEVEGRFNLSKSEDDWRTSTSLIEINKVFQNQDASYSLNHSRSIADIVKSSFDIRYTEKEDVENIKYELKKIIEKYGKENKLEIKQISPVCYTSKENKFIKQFKNVVDSIECNDIPVSPSAGASDLRFFSSKGIPCLNFGPDGKNHHNKNEYVKLTSIENFYEIIIKYVDNYL